jgi:hypothetical protein
MPTKLEYELNTRISFPDLGHDFGLIQNVAKVCRMLTNLLGSSWSNSFTLEVALGNVLVLKSKLVRTARRDAYEIRI